MWDWRAAFVGRMIPCAMTPASKSLRPIQRQRAAKRDGTGTILANAIASTIAERVVMSKLQPGTKVGSEAEFMKHLKVSRAPLREAIRILEWQGLVAPERGGAGGLNVAGNAISATANMLRTHLQLSDISLHDLLEAGSLISSYMLARVAQTITAEQVGMLRGSFDLAWQRLRQGEHTSQTKANVMRDIASLLDNPAGKAFAHTVVNLGADFDRMPVPRGRTPTENSARMMKNIEQLIDALSEHDEAAALATIREMGAVTTAALTEQERRDPKVWATQSFLLGDHRRAIEHVPASEKSAVQLAFAMAAKIRRKSVAPGTRLGTQASLLPEQKVGMKVFREAARLLDFFGIVQMRVGKQGGMFAIHPQEDTVVEWACRYLQWVRISAADVAELQAHLCFGSVALAAARITSEDVLQLKILTERIPTEPPERQSEVVQALQDRLVSMSRNRVLTLFETVLLEMQRMLSGTSVREDLADATERNDVLRELTRAFLESDQKGLQQQLILLRASLGKASSSTLRASQNRRSA